MLDNTSLILSLDSKDSLRTDHAGKELLDAQRCQIAQAELSESGRQVVSDYTFRTLLVHLDMRGSTVGR
jgi:hypothetical protein